MSQSGTDGHVKNACVSGHVSALVFLESEVFKRQDVAMQCRIVHWWPCSLTYRMRLFEVVAVVTNAFWPLPQSTLAL